MKMTKSKANRVWIKSLIIIIIVILSLIAIMTTWIIDTFTNEVIGLNHSVTLMVQRNIDTRLKEVEKILSIIELHPMNISLRKANDFEEMPKESVYNFHNQINNYKITNQFIAQIYIYYPKIDMVVGDIGSFPSQSYYRLNNSLKKDGYLTWKHELNQLKSGGYYLQQKNSGKTLYFGSRLPYNFDSEADAVIIVEIDDKELKAALNTPGDITTFTTLMDHRNWIYNLENSEDMKLLLTIPKSYIEEEGMFRYRENFITSQQSQHKNLRYITVSKTGEILSLTYTMRYVTYISIVLCLIFGIYVSIYVVKRNNTPIFSILGKILGNDTQYPKDEHRNEYMIINQNIDKMILETSKSHQMLDQQQFIIESLFLSNILNAGQTDNFKIFATAQHFDLMFEDPLYQVIIIRNTDKNKPDLSDEVSHILLAIRKSHKDIYIIGTQYRNDIVLLLNFDNGYDMNEIKKLAKIMEPTLLSYGNFIITIGHIYDLMSSIILSYSQAYEVAEIQEKEQGGIYVSGNIGLENNPHITSNDENNNETSISERAKQFIDDNYTDPMIGLYSISDELEVSNSYLSTLFKEEFDIGIVHYINKLRVGQAKELMETTNMLIKEIAILVGFSSDVSFIRVFRKYEHITPGKYRKNLTK